MDEQSPARSSTFFQSSGKLTAMDRIIRFGKGSLIIGRSTSNSGTDTEMHFHSFIELYYLEEGERTYFIGDREYRVNAGDLVMIPADILHRTGGKKGTRMLVQFDRAFLLNCFTDEMTDYLLSGIRGGVFFAVPEVKKKLFDLFDGLLKAETEYRNSPDMGLRLSACTFSLLSYLKVLSNDRGLLCEKDEAAGRVGDILRYINENYATVTGTAEIADAFYLSRFYLCHLFRETLGIPVVEYLNMVRIREACRRMETTRDAIGDIALACGFNSTSYFARVFKNEMGVSAGEYRHGKRGNRMMPDLIDYSNFVQ